LALTFNEFLIYLLLTNLGERPIVMHGSKNEQHLSFPDPEFNFGSLKHVVTAILYSLTYCSIKLRAIENVLQFPNNLKNYRLLCKELHLCSNILKIYCKNIY